MANSLYGLARQAFLEGALSWSSETIRCYLVDTADYTVAIDTDTDVSNIASAGRVGQSPAFTSKDQTLGTADAANVTLSDDGTGSGGVTGDESEAIVIYEETGSVETDYRLIAYIDTATGLPVTPNGGDITVQWDDGADKIFTL